MLTDLRAQVIAEGEGEATTYDTFACFCKSTLQEKLTAIEETESQKSEFEATLASLTGQREEADTTIAEKTEEIATLHSELEALHKTRHDAKMTYAKDEMDLTEAIQAISSAIEMLQAT